MDDVLWDRAQTVLQRAALVSLYGNGPRTIGPDIKPLIVETKVEQPQALPDATQKVRQEFKKAETFDINTCTFPDINAISASIVRREVDQECKRSVFQQLKQIKERHQSAINERLAAQQQSENQQQLASSRAKKLESDKHLLQQAEQLAKTELESQQRAQDALQRQKNQKLHLLTIEGVSRFHQRFYKKYEEVTSLLLALDKETLQACAGLNTELRELVQLFDQLVGKINNANLEPPELDCVFKAEKYCKSLDRLEENLHKQLSEQEQQLLKKAKQLAEETEKKRIIEAEELKKQQQQQQQQKQQQELEAQVKATADAAAAATAAAAAAAATSAATPGQDAQPQQATATTTTTAPSSQISQSNVHPTRLAFYNDIIALYQSKVDAVKPLQTDEALKKYRTNCQHAINMPLNAITAVSSQHLTTNFDKLYNFFAGQPVRTMDGSSISINDHPLARDYCILLMAKKFVSQSDTAISSNPQAAFPFASVIVTFWKLLPDFGKIFLAYMYKESPYLVPYLIPEQPGQTPEQYLKTMGYRIAQNNELEKKNIFLKRQTGLARLYAAVIITPGRKADGPAHCFGLEEAWCWLTHIMQVRPLPDLCATLIMEMLQTLGFELWRAYGQNFLKLLLYIQNIYMPQLAIYDQGGPKARLDMLLSKFLRERQIPQAVGVLPPSFW